MPAFVCDPLELGLPRFPPRGGFPWARAVSLLPCSLAKWARCVLYFLLADMCTYGSLSHALLYVGVLSHPPRDASL